MATLLPRPTTNIFEVGDRVFVDIAEVCNGQNFERISLRGDLSPSAGDVDKYPAIIEAAKPLLIKMLEWFEIEPEQYLEVDLDCRPVFPAKAQRGDIGWHFDGRGYQERYSRILVSSVLSPVFAFGEIPDGHPYQRMLARFRENHAEPDVRGVERLIENKELSTLTCDDGMAVGFSDRHLHTAQLNLSDQAIPRVFARGYFYEGRPQGRDTI